MVEQIVLQRDLRRPGRPYLRVTRLGFFIDVCDPVTISVLQPAPPACACDSPSLIGWVLLSDLRSVYPGVLPSAQRRLRHTVGGGLSGDRKVAPGWPGHQGANETTRPSSPMRP